MGLSFIEALKVIFLGIVEGITEWLPISSTGHMLLVDEFLQLDMSRTFKEMFSWSYSWGSILAVVVLFWDKMFPLPVEGQEPECGEEGDLLPLVQVVVAIPGAVVTILFDDYIEAHLHTPVVIAAALITYGAAFILVENWNKRRTRGSAG